MRRVALVVLLSTVLAACTSPPATITPSPMLSPATPTPPPPTETATPVAPGPLVTRLTLWLPEEVNPYGDLPGDDILNQQLQGFNQAYSDLQVEVIVKKAHGRGGLLDFMRTASEAQVTSVLPDLVVLDADDLQVAAQEGLLQPLDGLLPEDLAIDRFPFAVALGQVDGQTMGIPLTAELEHLVYRPYLLPSPPVSWTAVLSSGTGFVFPAAGQDGSVNDVTLVQYLGAGGHLTDGDGQPVLEAEPLLAVLDFYTHAVAARVISPTVVLALSDSEQSWEMVQNWQAGMGIVNSRLFLAQDDPALAAGIIPTRDGHAVALADVEWVLVMVTKDPARQQEAMRLVEWLLSPDLHGAWTQARQVLPTTRSGVEAWAVPAEERAVLEALLEGAQLAPSDALRQVIGPPMQEAVEAVLRGQKTPAEAVSDSVDN